MTAAALSPTPMQAPRAPRQPQNTASSFLLALAMHALLVAALWVTVQWRTQPSGPVVAELWGALPPIESASPPPPPPVVQRAPEPEVPKVDIAIPDKKAPPIKPEEKKPPVDQRKLDEAKRKAEDDKRKADEEKRVQAQREAIRKAEEQRMLKQLAAGPAAASGPAVGGSGRGDASYEGLLISLIKPRIVFAVPEGTSPQIYADFQVDLLPTGEILAVKLLKPSGLPGYDAAVERAIRRTDPFPRKRDGSVDRSVLIRFRPVDTQ